MYTEEAMHSTLERYKAFPFIAWAIFLMFAAFTFHLALELQETAAYLEVKMNDNVTAINGV